MPKSLESVLAALGVPADDPHVVQALTRRAWVAESGESHPDHEPLECLGDALLGFLIAEELLARHPGIREGEISLRRSELVRNEPTLREVGEGLQLLDHVRMGAGESGQSQVDGSALADHVEALVGAVYRAAGLDAAREFMRAVLGDRLQHRPAAPVLGAVSRLNELSLARTQRPLSKRDYAVEEEASPTRFRATIAFDGRSATGEWAGRKDAARESAAAAWLSGESG